MGMSLARWFVLVALAIVAPASFAGAQHPSTVVVVVRHAEKDSVPANDPPLTPAGRARANALATALMHAGVGTVITTDLLRARETARPLAEKLGLTPTIVPRGTDLARHVRQVVAAVRRHPGATVLVVGHGETVGPIIAALGGPTIPNLCAFEYSNMYTLVLDGGGSAVRFIQSSYGATSPPHTSSCATMMR